MKRLTEKHYKPGDGYYMRCSETCHIDCGEKSYCEEVDNIVDRLGSIEDILGDDYDLDRLQELVKADLDGRCVVLPPYDYTWTIRGDVIRDLIQCNCRAAEKNLKGEKNG